MIKNIVRYLGLALVIVGIVLVMKNLFSTDTGNWNSKDVKSNKVYYEANIKLLDAETEDYIMGSNLVLKNAKDEVIDEWTTKEEEHTVIKLEKGTYVLEQTSVADGYEDDKKTITFKVSNENKEIVMYNTAKVEEVKETSSEINVDNTLSTKSYFSVVISIIIMILGTRLILMSNKR